MIFCIGLAGGSEKGIYIMNHTQIIVFKIKLIVVYGLLDVLKRKFIVCITQTNPRFQNKLISCIRFAGGSEKGIYSMNHINKSPFSKSSYFPYMVYWRF